MKKIRILKTKDVGGNLTRTFRPVLTKRDFTRRYLANEFGNRAPSWDTLDGYISSGYSGLVHVRNRIAGGPTWYDVPSAEVVEFTRHLVERGIATLEQLYWSGMAPTPKTVFQGEVRQSENYLDLYYSTVPKPMRASLLEGGRQAYGLTALGILKSLMDPTSLDWVHTLLENYPGHVVEFSTYSVNWGTLNLPTVIWEVRGY